MSASETSGNQCEHGVDVGAYALGALDEHEVEPFRAHLETCAECREELAQLQGVTDSLAIAVPHAQPSADLRGRLMATVRAEAELLRATGHEADRPVRARSVWRWRVLPGLVAAGALAAGVLIGALALGTGSPQQTRVIQAQVLPPAGHDATAALRKVGSHVQLQVTGMPAPALGRIYEVWLKDGSRPPQPTDALFSVTSQGNGTVGVPGDLRGVSTVMVTEEPAGGSLKPTHSPVIVASV
jgi:Anti-sigma-K factor rskA/Putative zinc-finger